MNCVSELIGANVVNEQYILHICLLPEVIRSIDNEFKQKVHINPTPCITATDLTFTSIDNTTNHYEPSIENPNKLKESTRQKTHNHYTVTHESLRTPNIRGTSDTTETSCELHCMWDTNTFSGKAVGLPTAFIPETGMYKTIGCYCSPGCAAASNMADARIGIDTRYERHALIEAMVGHPVNLAPDRECLRRFGGNKTIEDFRKSDSDKDRILYPPLCPQRVYHVFHPKSFSMTTNDRTKNTKQDEDDDSWTKMLRPRKVKSTLRGLGQFMDVRRE